MTLIERWKNMSDSDIAKEMKMLFEKFSSAIYLFTTDENSEQIRYCIDYRQDETVEKYGKQAGVCISEKAALENIRQVLIEYNFLLIPFYWSDLPAMNLGVKLENTIGVEYDENGQEYEFKEAVFEFKKCKNQAGFCVSKVIPLRNKQ